MGQLLPTIVPSRTRITVKNQENRQPEDLVEDLLAKHYDWTAILAVTRCTRKGAWYEEVTQILREKGLMPKPEEMAKTTQEVIANRKAARKAQAEAQNQKKPKKRKA